MVVAIFTESGVAVLLWRHDADTGCCVILGEATPGVMVILALMVPVNRKVLE
jgi:hypothetical protein